MALDTKLVFSFKNLVVYFVYFIYIYMYESAENAKWTQESTMFCQRHFSQCALILVFTT